MAFRRRYKRRFRRRRRRTRRRRVVDSHPVPNSKLVKLRYSDTFPLDPSAATAAHYLFSANGIYDPNITGIGHQPMGFDEWMTFYDHYKVLGSKCTITFQNQGATLASNVVCGIYLNDDTSSSVNITDMIEQRDTNWRFIEPIGGNSTINVTKGFSARKSLGSKFTTAEAVGSALTNPAEQSFFDVWAASSDATVNPPIIQCVAVIEYTVRLSERRTLTPS